MKLMICICWLSFYFQGYCQFVRYQTFDEYKMEGITNKRIRRPCVFIKWESDTIFVIKSNDKDESKKSKKYHKSVLEKEDYEENKKELIT